MTMYLVTSPHKGIYPDPIVVGSGDQLELSGKSDNWDGYVWLWARAGDGREGWVPDDLAIARNNKVVAAYNYSALELDVDTGEKISCGNQSHGWAWCRNENGQEGWVPLKVLKPC